MNRESKIITVNCWEKDEIMTKKTENCKSNLPGIKAKPAPAHKLYSCTLRVSKRL